jgi:high-affinity K+ transport system ATPase subunit B
VTGTSRSDESFVDRVMGEVARQERRRVPVALALSILVLVLAVPALVALAARPALDAGLALAVAGLGELVSSTADNPFFWAGVAITVLWLGWLASRALMGRP